MNPETCCGHFVLIGGLAVGCDLPPGHSGDHSYVRGERRGVVEAMGPFATIASQIGELVERKNLVYGSSFAKAGAALRLLYPNGIGPDQLDDALLLARIWDKLQRIATARDALGESPYRDIAGYGILGAYLHETKAPSPSGEDQCSNVSALDARASHETTTATARPSAGEQ